MPVILSVDDDPSFQVLVKSIFRHTDIEIVSALNADDGLRLAREVIPALILMDIRLPGQEMDGWAVIEQIKKDPALSHIPVIVVTAADGYEDSNRASEAGCVAFVQKPFNVRAFKEIVDQCLCAR